MGENDESSVHFDQHLQSPPVTSPGHCAAETSTRGPFPQGADILVSYHFKKQESGKGSIMALTVLLITLPHFPNVLIGSPVPVS